VAHSINAAVVGVGYENKLCMYKSFKFALFNESFPNPAKFQMRPNFGCSRISAGFVKMARFRPEPEPNSGTALIIYLW